VTPPGSAGEAGVAEEELAAIRSVLFPGTLTIGPQTRPPGAVL
jgi:hypothetical protein